MKVQSSFAVSPQVLDLRRGEFVIEPQARFSPRGNHGVDDRGKRTVLEFGGARSTRLPYRVGQGCRAANAPDSVTTDRERPARRSNWWMPWPIVGPPPSHVPATSPRDSEVVVVAVPHRFAGGDLGAAQCTRLGERAKSEGGLARIGVGRRSIPARRFRARTRQRKFHFAQAQRDKAFRRALLRPPLWACSASGTWDCGGVQM